MTQNRRKSAKKKRAWRVAVGARARRLCSHCFPAETLSKVIVAHASLEKKKKSCSVERRSAICVLISRRKWSGNEIETQFECVACNRDGRTGSNVKTASQRWWQWQRRIANRKLIENSSLMGLVNWPRSIWLSLWLCPLSRPFATKITCNDRSKCYWNRIFPVNGRVFCNFSV